MVVGLGIVQQQQKYCKICMDDILEFLHQIKYETITENLMLPWFNTKQYTLCQFYHRIEKQQNKEICIIKIKEFKNIYKWTPSLYDFQAWIWNGLEILDNNNVRWRKVSR